MKVRIYFRDGRGAKQESVISAPDLEPMTLGESLPRDIPFFKSKRPVIDPSGKIFMGLVQVGSFEPVEPSAKFLVRK